VHSLLGFEYFDAYIKHTIGKSEREASKRFDTAVELKQATLKTFYLKRFAE
jgi:hypothetical protein